MKLWLDDERDPTEWLPHIRWWRGRDPSDLDDWIWVRTASEAIARLESENISEASLDHDLGDPDVVGDGYIVATWIEERAAYDDGYEPPVLHIHTSNVGARPRLEAVVVSIDRILARRGS